MTLSEQPTTRLRRSPAVTDQLRMAYDVLKAAVDEVPGDRRASRTDRVKYTPDFLA